MGSLYSRSASPSWISVFDSQPTRFVAFCREGLWLSPGIEIEDPLAENTDGDPTGAPKERLRMLQEMFREDFSAKMRGGEPGQHRGGCAGR